MTSHVATTPQWRPAGLPGCEPCAGRGDGTACNSHFRRWRDHGRPASGVPAPTTRQAGVNAKFWLWLSMDHSRGDAALADQLGVVRRTLCRWRRRREAMIAAGELPPPPPPRPVVRGLKGSDSGYGTYGTNTLAGVA